MRFKHSGKIKDLISDRIWTIDTSSSGPVYAEIVKIVYLVRKTFNDFAQNRMGFQCVALSYFVTLAMVPFVAFAFAITGGLGLASRIPVILHTVFPSNQDVVDLLTQKADEMLTSFSVDGLGLISAFLFLCTILWMMFQVERVFNNVWGIRKIPRKIYKRFGFYILVLFLSPFLVITFGTGLVYATNMTNLVGLDLTQVRFLIKLLGYTVFYIVVVFTMSIMYKYIPAVHVRYKDALRAAIIAGIIFVLFQYLYLNTQMFVGRLNRAYGVLATIPLFLIWLNFSWQIIIYGAQLSRSFNGYNKLRVRQQQNNHWESDQES